MNTKSQLPPPEALRHWDGKVGRGTVRQQVGRGTVRQQVSLLPPAPGHTAKAEVTLPAGFRKVRSGAFGGPVWPCFTVG